MHLAFLLTLTTASACHCDQARPRAKPVDIPGLSLWQGSVGKADIILALYASDNGLNGQFRSAKAITFVRATSAKTPEGEVTLHEFGDDGDVTGTFVGQVDRDVYSGTWLLPMGNTTVPFRFTRQPIANAEHLAGTYVAGQAEIKLGEPSNGKVFVDAFASWRPANGASPNVGYVDGTYALVNDVVQLRDKFCNMDIRIRDGILVATELEGSSCGGFNVSFDSAEVGPYLRKP